MPRTASPTRTAIKRLLTDYTDRLVALVERGRPSTDAAVLIRERVLDALAGLGGRRHGRPRGSKNRIGTLSASAATAAPPRRRKQTPAQRKANRLQGAYMGTIRLLSVTDKEKVKAVREKDGVVAAIALAKKMRKAAA